MPTPQREPLRRLSRAEQAALQQIAKSSSERIDHVRRAAALLAVARGGVYIQAAREAGLRSGTTVPTSSHASTVRAWPPWRSRVVEDAGRRIQRLAAR